MGFTEVRGGTFPGGVQSRVVRFASNYIELLSVDPSQALPGKPWEDLIRGQIFAPLGIRNAGFGLPGTSDKPFE